MLKVKPRSQVWQRRSLIPAFKRQRQKDLCEFKASLVYRATSRIAWAMQRKTCLQNQASKQQQNQAWYLSTLAKYSEPYPLHLLAHCFKLGLIGSPGWPQTEIYSPPSASKVLGIQLCRPCSATVCHNKNQPKGLTLGLQGFM